MIFMLFLLIVFVVWLLTLPFRKHLTFWSQTGIVSVVSIVVLFIVVDSLAAAMGY